MDAAPLEGVWGLERFGMASPLTRRLIEALPGLADACPAYVFLETRGKTWAEEERRLAGDRSRKRAKPAAAKPVAKADAPQDGGKAATVPSEAPAAAQPLVACRPVRVARHWCGANDC